MTSQMKHTSWFFILSGFLVGILLSLGILAGLDVIDMTRLMPGLSSKRSSTGGSLEIGKPAPDFMLADLSGKQVELSDFLGKVVVLNFWATWCGPCWAEMPVFEEVSRAHQGDIVVVGVNFQQPLDEVIPFVNAVKITFPILLDPEGLAARFYRVIQLPNTFFIDRQGVIQFRHIGSISPDQLDDYLSRLGVIE